MKLFRGLKYYLASVFTLISKFKLGDLINRLTTKGVVLIRMNNGLSFYTSNLMDIWTLKETICDQFYNHYQPIHDSDLVVDVGGYIGDFSVYAGKKANKVIVYEPDKQRLSLLKQNITINGLTNIDLIEKPATNLRDIMRGIDKCNFLKVDCEGGEYQIFSNTDKSDLEKIDYIAMEVHLFNQKMKQNFSILYNSLFDSGFEVKTIDNQVHSDLKYLYAKKI